jgi:CheY-like chemotaxis protein
VTHVLRGESSLEELMRVVDVPFDDVTAGAAGEKEAATPAAPAATGAGSAASVAPPPSPRASGPRPGTQFGGGSFELLDNIDAGVTVTRVKRKVLLVDDEDTLRRVMKDLLEREGYIVAEARDGVQALDQVDRFGPDVIVLDLNLPGLDGYGVLSHLRSRPATSDIPVVVLTAKSDEDNEVRVFQLGADDFLTKPFRARALSARLDAVLGRKRLSP